MNILLVDDSALIRSIVKSFFEFAQDMTVAGEASNGERAIEMNRELQPDFIIMDVKMPIMDGLEATRRIMRERPVPILIFSTEVDAHVSYEAIDSGAVDVMRKPNMDQFNDPAFYQHFLQEIRLLAKKRRIFSSRVPVVREKSEEKKKEYHLLVIGASTGGPAAVKELLQGLPGAFPFGIAIVQHLEKGFDRGYVRWLDEATALHVRLAEKTEFVKPGDVLVAPVDKHLIVHGSRLMLDDSPRVLNQKPSVDVLFQSAAKHHGERLLGVLLTGMGRDGANGCTSILSQGGFTVVQDEATSAIFGMPKAAIETGGASTVLPLHEIAGYLVDLVM